MGVKLLEKAINAKHKTIHGETGSKRKGVGSKERTDNRTALKADRQKDCFQSRFSLKNN